MNPFEPFARHMCIYLRRGNISVPKQHLYYSQVRAVIKQVGSKRVAKRVGRQSLGNTR